MKSLLRPLLAILPLVSLLAAGCGGGGGGGDTLPENTMELDGTRMAISSVEVWYDGEVRYVEFHAADGTMIELVFEYQGDPLETAYELPLGDWTAFDSEFTMVSLYLAGPAVWATYQSPDAFSGLLTMNGAPPDRITVDGDLGFEEHAVRVRYSGDYLYDAD